MPFVFVVIGFILLGVMALLVSMCTNHFSSVVVASVTAAVVGFSHVPGWVEFQPMYDGNGRQTGVIPIVHPDEYHVLWQHDRYVYDQICDDPEYCGREKGDTEQMVLRHGGVTKDTYLWPD